MHQNTIIQMKKILFTTLLSIFLFSCSSSDEPTNDETVYPPTDYLSIKSGNYWTYDVENSTGTTGRDSLYTANDTVISGITYKKYKTKNAPYGYFSASFRNNAIRKIEDKLVLTGKANTVDGLTIPLNLDLSLIDFIVFKENSTANTELDSRSGSFVQTVQDVPFPLKITYKLSTVAGENLASYVVKGVTFNNIKKMKSILNLKIDLLIATSPIELTQPVLTSQDVVISEQYFAKNVGVVYVKTNTSYQLSALPAGVTIPFPSSSTTSQEEFIDTYHINP